MSQPSNKLTNLWQELKRRKVVRVVSVYAAAAFVILELVDIITDPFGLPEWTMILVVVLLTVGFIISVIISWIYDIHPEGGIVKTESVSDQVPDRLTAGPTKIIGWKKLARSMTAFFPGSDILQVILLAYLTIRGTMP